jgi:hypothetical protein
MTMTIKQVAQVLATQYASRTERRASIKENTPFLKKVHSSLNEGGQWVIPHNGWIFRKNGAGFERVQ